MDINRMVVGNILQQFSTIKTVRPLSDRKGIQGCTRRDHSQKIEDKYYMIQVETIQYGIYTIYDGALRYHLYSSKNSARLEGRLSKKYPYISIKNLIIRIPKELCKVSQSVSI
jgi:hypothetical protein